VCVCVCVCVRWRFDLWLKSTIFHPPVGQKGAYLKYIMLMNVLYLGDPSSRNVEIIAQRQISLI
jgi:hypothetical protein